MLDDATRPIPAVAEGPPRGRVAEQDPPVDEESPPHSGRVTDDDGPPGAGPEDEDSPGDREDAAQAQADKRRIAFVDIGRAVGALLVFYSHIAEQWVHRRHDNFAPVDVVDALTSGPLHMSKQGIGQIAVPMFFLISGYVVTPIAMRQGAGRFAVNRLFRVYPPLIFAVLLTAGVLSLGINPLVTGQLQTVSPFTLLTNSLLVNYLIYPQVVLIGVAWTMIVEVTFYLVLVLLVPVLRRWVWLALAVELTFVFVVLMSRSAAGPSWSLFAVNVSYLPIPIIGQIIWAGYTRRIQPWLAGTFLAMAWGLYVLGDILDVGRIDSSYNLALCVAVLCFLVGLFAEARLRERRFWTALSERSYSLYLLHGLAAFVTLDLLRPHVPFVVALVAAVAVTFAVVELSYRCVEQPSHQLARRLSRSRAEARSDASADSDGAEDDEWSEDEDWSEDGWSDEEWSDEEWSEGDESWPDTADAPTTSLPRVDAAAEPSPPYGFPAAGGFRPVSGSPVAPGAETPAAGPPPAGPPPAGPPPAGPPPAATPAAGSAARRIEWPAEDEPGWPEESWPPEPGFQDFGPRASRSPSPWPPDPWPQHEPDPVPADGMPVAGWTGEPSALRAGSPGVGFEAPAPGDQVPPPARQSDREADAHPDSPSPALPRRRRHGAADETGTTVADLIAKQANGSTGNGHQPHGRSAGPRPARDPEAPAHTWTPPNRRG